MLFEEPNNPIESSVIKNFTYNFTNNRLRVYFKSGQVYEYENVDNTLYQDLCEAESHGKFFTEKIKNTHSHIKLLLD